ncbi:hypothetical protein ACWD4O_42365 [Streptomyces sp. NPDC002623]
MPCVPSRRYSPVTEHELQGGTGRQAAVVRVHVLVRPLTRWCIVRSPATAPPAPAPAPARDPDRVAIAP